ncbi:MAG: hypothetical protein A2Y97_12120 [Nitrospirae bacterium RBG_13_39_12]|nr:MAG: hypothetical protein A2Y97_12120 [Nitrospirae bacterium RBG_13_39_12]
MPSYKGIDVRDVLDSRNVISDIEAEFSAIFERDDTEIRGDGILDISRNGDLSIRIYSFGFLALELTSENGIIKSTPVIDKNKGIILTYGLRDCLFWWDIKDFKIDEIEDKYRLKNLSREIWIDRKTMLPVKQKVYLEDDRELMFYYENPENAGDIWYPSKIRVEFSKYSLTLNFKEMSFFPRDLTRGQQLQSLLQNHLLYLP